MPAPPDQTAQARLSAGRKRDADARVRDRAALARDDVADARNDRVLAGEQRQLAAHDRHAAALDRRFAGRERRHARADRVALAGLLTLTETDPLTGARMRAAGLSDLERELPRCRRADGQLVLVYVDVVGLKALNDTQGHAAGDELLRTAVRQIKAHLRPYDLIIRLGGDEFACAMSGATLDDARERFRAISAELARAPGATAIRTGFAALATGQTAAQLIARADDELVGNRRARTPPACRP